MRHWFLGFGVLMAAIVVGAAAWWKEQWIKESIDWLTDVRGQVITEAQAEIAATLKIKQPSVSKIEKQTDMSVDLAQLRRGYWGRARSRSPVAAAPGDAAAPTGRDLEWLVQACSSAARRTVVIR
jgi:hypothetical protein